MSIIETAAQLYREMKDRGLEFRSENGRDNKLLNSLASRLGFDPKEFQISLDKSDMKAEVFLLQFLEIAEPFSKMYQEIWQFLDSSNATRATESIFVRFGFDHDLSKISLNLDDFRAQAKRLKEIEVTKLSLAWPTHALDKLKGLHSVLSNTKNSNNFRNHQRRLGKAWSLPLPITSTHPFDKIVLEIRNIFQQFIDNSVSPNHKGNDQTNILTGLIFLWCEIFQDLHHLSFAVKDEASEYYRLHISPLLRTRKEMVSQFISEMLDILNLPFWKLRWHMYEVWCNVRVLKALEDFQPVLRIKEGRVPLDGYESAIVADLQILGYPNACVGVQCQTPYEDGKRKGIRPDLRVCFDQNVDFPESTAMVIEYKQHQVLNEAYIKEIMQAYTKGCPMSGGLILVNYDVSEINATLPEGTTLISNFHPGNTDAIKHFNGSVDEKMLKAGLRVNTPKILLLGVWNWMWNSYQPIATLLSELHQRNDIEIIHFDRRLKETEVSKNYTPLVSDYRNIPAALEELYKKKGHLKEVIMVTDEDCSIKQTPFIDRLHECPPANLATLLKRLKW